MDSIQNTSFERGDKVLSEFPINPSQPLFELLGASVIKMMVTFIHSVMYVQVQLASITYGT